MNDKQTCRQYLVSQLLSRRSEWTGDFTILQRLTDELFKSRSVTRDVTCVSCVTCVTCVTCDMCDICATWFIHKQDEPAGKVVSGQLRADITKNTILREAFIKKKSVTFFTLGSDRPPYFPESVSKIKKKIRLLKCNIKPWPCLKKKKV